MALLTLTIFNQSNSIPFGAPIKKILNFLNFLDQSKKRGI